MQLALKDPERLAAVMAPIPQMLVELLKAAAAAGSLQVTETRRAAVLIQQTVMYGWLMNRFVQNPQATRHGRGRLGVLPPRSRRLTPNPQPDRPSSAEAGVPTRA